MLCYVYIAISAPLVTIGWRWRIHDDGIELCRVTSHTLHGARCIKSGWGTCLGGSSPALFSIFTLLFGFSDYDEIVCICPASVGYAAVAGRHDEFSASCLVGYVPPVT